MNTKFKTIPELRTARLSIRAFNEDDLPSLLKMRPEPRGKLEEMPAYLNKVNTEAITGTAHLWGVSNIDRTEELYGYVRLFNYETDISKIEIGCLLFPEYWGKGFMTEAAKAVCEFAFHKMKAQEILALIRKDNVPSLKLIKRLEFGEHPKQEDDKRILFSLKKEWSE